MSISWRAMIAGPTFLLMVAISHGAEIPPAPEPAGVDEVASPKLHSGTVRITDEKADGPLHKTVRVFAQNFAFSVVQPPYNGEPDPKVKSTVFVKDITTHLKKVEDFCTLFVQPGTSSLNQAQVEFADVFSTEMAAAAKVVLDNLPKDPSQARMEKLNIVRVLAAAAKMPGTKMVDTLLSIINDPMYSDAYKLYAFQGLRTHLEHGLPEDPTRHLLARDPVRLGQISDTLSKYILQTRIYRDDKERLVIEYVRREAVAALGRFKEGVVRKNTREPVSRPGYTLLRMLYDQEMAPPITIQERVEVISGFCQMKIDDDLNIDVAAPFLHPSLIEFARQNNNDSIRMRKDGGLPMLPWKIAAARISFAMATWRETAKKPQKAKYPEYITTLAAEVIPAFAPIEKEGAGAVINIEALSQWVNRNLPKAWDGGNRQPVPLYKDDPTSLLPPVPKQKSPEQKTPPNVNPKGPLPKVDPKGPPPKIDPKGPAPKVTPAKM